MMLAINVTVKKNLSKQTEQSATVYSEQSKTIKQQHLDKWV